MNPDLQTLTPITTCPLSIETMDKLQSMTNQELSDYVQVHISCDSLELIFELSTRYFGLLNKIGQSHDTTK